MSEPVLRQLTLKRFRSLPAEVVEFDNPTFLVGKNGSGKSNFTDAFAFLAEAMASPLQVVLARRGGFSKVGNRSSARGRPSNLGLAVLLQNPDDDTTAARYSFELRPLKSYGFNVVREQCIVDRVDGSRSWFDRRATSAGWRSNVSSLVPVMEPNALALPLVGGDTRFQSVLRFLSDMQICQIEPAALRDPQNPDEGIRLHPDGSNAASVLREIERAAPEDWKRILELLESIVPRTVDVQPKKHGIKADIGVRPGLGIERTGEIRSLQYVRWHAPRVGAAGGSLPTPSPLAPRHRRTGSHNPSRGAGISPGRAASRQAFHAGRGDDAQSGHS